MLQALWASDVEFLSCFRNKDKLCDFVVAHQIPVLITEECCFLITVITDQGQMYLQPVHQSIFAMDNMLVAFRSKEQLHGWLKSFKALSIK